MADESKTYEPSLDGERHLKDLAEVAVGSVMTQAIQGFSIILAMALTSFQQEMERAIAQRKSQIETEKGGG